MGEQIASITALVKDSVVRLFDDVGRAMESGPDNRVMVVVRTAVNGSVTIAF